MGRVHRAKGGTVRAGRVPSLDCGRFRREKESADRGRGRSRGSGCRGRRSVLADVVRGSFFFPSCGRGCKACCLLHRRAGQGGKGCWQAGLLPGGHDKGCCAWSADLAAAQGCTAWAVGAVGTAGFSDGEETSDVRDSPFAGCTIPLPGQVPCCAWKVPGTWLSMDAAAPFPSRLEARILPLPCARKYSDNTTSGTVLMESAVSGAVRD